MTAKLFPAWIRPVGVILLLANGDSYTAITGKTAAARGRLPSGSAGLRPRAWPDSRRAIAARNRWWCHPGVAGPHSCVDAARPAAWRDAQVHPIVGSQARRPAHHRRPRVARRPSATASAGALHAVNRSRLRDKGGGRDRSLSRPADHAVVLCIDEKTAIQGHHRIDPLLPLSHGRAERHGFESSWQNQVEL